MAVMITVWLLPKRLGGTADAYVELKDYDKAETYFKKAADKANNKFLTPLYLKKLEPRLRSTKRQ